MHLPDTDTDTGDSCPVCDRPVLGIVCGADTASKSGWIDMCVAYHDPGSVYYLHGTIGTPPTEADA